MNQITKVTLVVGVILLVRGLLPSDVWSLCAIDQQIELTRQGLAQNEIDKMCRDTAARELLNLPRGEPANGPVQGRSNRLTGPAGDGQSDPTLPSRDGAHFCQTSYGSCPLSGGPAGYPCHCPGWNGYLFTGVSR